MSVQPYLFFNGRAEEAIELGTIYVIDPTLGVDSSAYPY